MNNDDAWMRGHGSESRSEADLAHLVIRQTDQMIAMAKSMNLQQLLPILEKVRDEAESVLAASSERLAN